MKRRTRTVRDLELEACSRAHYDDPAYYRATYADRSADAAYYLNLALASGGPVLEYGAGNGRIALPMLKHGLDVTGVDLSTAMTNDFRAWLAGEPPHVRKRATLRVGDMRTLSLSRRYPLVLCTFNTFLHLYTHDDAIRFLARVKAHLAKGGTFVLDASMPMMDDLRRTPDKPLRTRGFRHPTLGPVRYQERFQYEAHRQILFVSMEFRTKDGQEFVTPLAHRQYFPMELEALLVSNGFRITQKHGDFEGGPLASDSDVIIFHARVSQ